MLIFPAECCLAALAINIGYSVGASQKDSFFSGTTTNVHNGIEEVGFALTALEGLGDEIIVGGEVGSTVDATVTAVTFGQIVLERLGLHFGCVFLLRRLEDFHLCGGEQPVPIL